MREMVEMVINMNAKEIGTVSIDETEMIRKIYFRKMALQELIPIIDFQNDLLYQKIIGDLMETNSQMQEWWRVS